MKISALKTSGDVMSCLYQADHSSDLTQALNDVKNNHKMWSNPLLIACKNGHLTRDDFKFIFSQYYFYSKNFTKLLAIGMMHSDSDYFRSMLSKNLWEEGGGQDIELRHAEIFRKFLIEALEINPEEIVFTPYTESFFRQYFDLCLNSTPSECAALLSFGTEGIISRLYSVFKIGLLNAGVSEDNLAFFNIHIACDDDHALTLEKIALASSHETNWLETCKKAITKVLDLRDLFFTQLYESIQQSKFNSLIHRISVREVPSDQSDGLLKKLNIKNIAENRLYQNEDLEKNIRFYVNRAPFDADVLDPRLLTIPAGFNNELHSHAHETVFLILSGSGEVVLGKNVIPVCEGDMVLVPRWIKHQTRNTGNQELKIFAITDYGLTKRAPQNSETCYRLNKENVTA